MGVFLEILLLVALLIEVRLLGGHTQLLLKGWEGAGVARLFG